MVTVRFASSTSSRLGLDELTGVTTVDQTVAANGTSRTFSSGATRTTTAARWRVLGVVGTSGATAAAAWATGWTRTTTFANGGRCLGRAYRTPTTVGTFTATGTTTGAWAAAVVTFR